MTLKNVLAEKGLTSQESDVTELVAKGLSNKEVANQLFITEQDVKLNLELIYKNLEVKSRAQMIVFCLPYLLFPMNRDHVKISAETMINQSIEELRQMESIYGGVVIYQNSDKREVRILGSDNLDLKTIIKFESLDPEVNLDEVSQDLKEILNRERISVLSLNEFKANAGI